MVVIGSELLPCGGGYRVVSHRTNWRNIMQVQVTIQTAENTTESKVVKALTYAFPKKGNAAADYTLTIGGVQAEVAQTGGGKYPRYTYFKYNGTSYYLPKDVLPLSGTEIVIRGDLDVKVAKPVHDTGETNAEFLARAEACGVDMEGTPEALAEEVAKPVPAKKVRVPKGK